MDTLPEEIQNTIYKYEHQLKYHDVMREFHECIENLICEFHECMEDLICYCYNCGTPYIYTGGDK
jgi:hypothetical protein